MNFCCFLMRMRCLSCRISSSELGEEGEWRPDMVKLSDKVPTLEL